MKACYRLWGGAIASLLVLACESSAPPVSDSSPNGPGPNGPGGSGDPNNLPPGAEPDPDPWSRGPGLGARRYPTGDLEVRVRAPLATRLELCLFAQPLGEAERVRLPMTKDGEVYSLRVSAADLAAAGLDGAIYYGLRAFGPNWPYDPSFSPGSHAGFVKDVDDAGNRMNPNKLLLDPYALEVSHDPWGHGADGDTYSSGDGAREHDSGPLAPKGVVVALPKAPAAEAPTRPIRDEVVYEVHMRGLTRADPTVPENERGTYAGAARRARYLRELGVTTVELLPLHETPNDQNDLTEDASGDNYWGYTTVSYLAPDRRFAADKSPGGPTRELRAMVDAFHAEGLKVWVDVVFNHTAEGDAGGPQGSRASIWSLRGLDNAAFYELADDPRYYVNGNGVGPNLNTASPMGGNLVVDSLRYWHDLLGFDGYRFDLASIVSNGCSRGCYRFAGDGLPTRIAKELGRPDDGGAGVDLVAEPWGLAAGSYQVGHFPRGWSEWNDQFRDTIRRDLNRLGVEPVTPGWLAARLSGSSDAFDHDGRLPSASINFVSAHDGMTMFDVFSCDQKNNHQPWPYGPSDGGTDGDLAYSHGGDRVRQRGVTRTALAFAALSAGVPMITGGDEQLRSQRCNNNAYNLDSPGNWLDWTPSEEKDAFRRFTARVFAFRNAHRAVRPAHFWRGDADVRWYRDDGARAEGTYMDGRANEYLGMMLDGRALGDDAAAIYVAYSGLASSINVHLPAPPEGTRWWLEGDTSEAAESWGNWVTPTEARAVTSPIYGLGRRALAVFVAR